MPKAGFSSKDLAPDTGFGFERGKGEVVEAVVKVHQYPKSTKDPNKEQGSAFLCVQLGIIHLNDDLSRQDDEVKYVEISIGSKALQKFSVGIAKNAKDENPEDLGSELDTIGNCIFVKEEGSMIHPKTAWGTFVGDTEMKGGDKETIVYKGLQRAGFKPDVLGDGFIPDLIGMKAYFGHATREKWDGYQGEKDPTVFMTKEIYVFPYEKKGGKGQATGAGKGQAAGAAASKLIEVAVAKANGQAGPATDMMAHAITASKAVVADIQGQKGIELKTFRQKVQQKLLKLEVKPATMHPKILELLKQDESTAAIGAEAGFMVDEDGKIAWPE